MQPFEQSEKIVQISRNEEVPPSSPFTSQVPPSAMPPVSGQDAPSPFDVLRSLEVKGKRTLSTDRKKLLLYLVGGLFVLQVVLPVPLKPGTIIGQTMGSTYATIGGETANAEQVRQLEAALATAKQERASAISNCEYAALINLGQECEAVFGPRYDAQIAALEADLEKIRPKSITEYIFGD